MRHAVNTPKGIRARIAPGGSGERNGDLLQPMAEHAERSGEIWARRWVDAKEGA